MLQLFGGRGYHPIIRVLSALFLIGWAVASWRLFLMTLDAFSFWLGEG